MPINRLARSAITAILILLLIPLIMMVVMMISGGAMGGGLMGGNEWRHERPDDGIRWFVDDSRSCCARVTDCHHSSRRLATVMWR